MYYLQSRYYSPEIGRFISADSYAMTYETPVGANMFTYCMNNPVMGYDPTGHWDWGGVAIGVGIITVTALAVATLGVSSLVGAVLVGASIATGAVTTYAAATDSAMVLDLSYSKQGKAGLYGNAGGSVVIDFKNDNANFYPHLGLGAGYSDGASYSVGIVSDYNAPKDYSRSFVDVNSGAYVGFDHCWNPFVEHDTSTRAFSATFSTGYNIGIGYDYYFGPIQIFAW